jgi:hypothetical protein
MKSQNKQRQRSKLRIPVALFTKNITIKNCRTCKTKTKKSFTKILTIILSVKIVLTLRVKLPCRKCKIFVFFFIVSEKNRKKTDDALALRFKIKRAIHRWRIFSDRMTNLITHIDNCLLK